MNGKATTKLVREGDLVAEVTVRLVTDAGEWSPALSVSDATKLDDVRVALSAHDLARASRLADHVYRLTPLAHTDARQQRVAAVGARFGSGLARCARRPHP